MLRREWKFGRAVTWKEKNFQKGKVGAGKWTVLKRRRWERLSPHAPPAGRVGRTCVPEALPLLSVVLCAPGKVENVHILPDLKGGCI